MNVEKDQCTKVLSARLLIILWPASDCISRECGFLGCYTQVSYLIPYRVVVLFYWFGYLVKVMEYLISSLGSAPPFSFNVSELAVGRMHV